LNLDTHKIDKSGSAFYSLCVFHGCKSNVIEAMENNTITYGKENIVEVPLTNVYFPAIWSLIKQLSANLRQHFSFFS
jgi:hypothetical protein